MTSRPSRDDVLDAFSMEDRHDRVTLERYLRDFPDHALSIVDLSRELSRHVRVHDDPLSAAEQEMIEGAWRRHAVAFGTSSDPFSTLAAAEQRELARRLDVPRQVISGLRDRRVLVASIPRRFIGKIAAALDRTAEEIVGALSMPSGGLAKSYKSDVKPTGAERVTFDKLLADAGVPQAKRAEMTADDD